MLTKIGEMLTLEECDMACVGGTSGEFCGGTDRLSAYKIEAVNPAFMGCYADDMEDRALDMEEKYVSEDMTSEVRHQIFVVHDIL